jgi:nucleoside 2-deoxyribosyltransferase
MVRPPGRGSRLTMNLYVAAPLFSEAERVFNLTVARALEAEGHHVYLPQRDTPASQALRTTLDQIHAKVERLSVRTEVHTRTTTLATGAGVR